MAANYDVSGFPQTRLHANGLELVVFLPDAEKGIYRGTRFDWSGFVARATFRGHTWFGPWLDTVDPLRHDHVMGTAGEFGMGNNGVPKPLGFDEAGPSEPFVKIGVGKLAREQADYHFTGRFEILQPGSWKIRSDEASIEFRQAFGPVAGYAYAYTKRIAVGPDPGFTIAYTLANTGEKPIQQTYYAHNFTRIDDVPIGPDYRVTFPQAMTPDRDLKGIAEVQDRELTFLRSMEPGESIYIQFQEHDLPAAANGATVANTKTGAGLRITGDAAIARYHFWSMGRVLCPEPFVTIALAPGDSMTWTDRYELLLSETEPPC